MVKIINQVDIQQSDPEVLLKVFNRIFKLVKQNKGERELFAYILSPGTSDDLVLNEIKDAVDKFNLSKKTNLDNVKVYLIGLEDHRNAMSDVTSGIAAKAANGDTEWSQFTDDFDYPRCFQ